MRVLLIAGDEGHSMPAQEIAFLGRRPSQSLVLAAELAAASQGTRTPQALMSSFLVET